MLTLFINTGLPGGAALYGASGFPLFDGFKAIFAGEKIAYVFGVLFMIGLIASFFTIIFAYGRNTFSLSRAGYFPKFLSVTHGVAEDAARGADRRGDRRLRRGRRSIFILQEAELGAQIVAALLNMAVFAAVISYILQMVSFVVLRQKLPNIDRPYRQPVGRAGSGRRGRAGRDGADRDLPERGLSPGGLRRRDLLRPRRDLLRGRRTEPPGALTGGGVRAHAGEQGVPQASYETSAAAQEAILRGDAGTATMAAEPPPPPSTPSG